MGSLSIIVIVVRVESPKHQSEFCKDCKKNKVKNAWCLHHIKPLQTDFYTKPGNFGGSVSVVLRQIVPLLLLPKTVDSVVLFEKEDHSLVIVV